MPFAVTQRWLVALSPLRGIKGGELGLIVDPGGISSTPFHDPSLPDSGEDLYKKKKANTIKY
jgi:hypothetical protein